MFLNFQVDWQRFWKKNSAVCLALFLMMMLGSSGSVKAQAPANGTQSQAVYDQILNRNTNVSYAAIIQQTTRQDGLYSAPALTDTASMQPVTSGKAFNGQLAQVSEIDETRRASNGQIYQYAKITLAGRSYWLDLRGLEAFTYAKVVNRQTNINGQGYINEQGRNDGVFQNGPALTSAETFKADFSGSSVNLHSVQIMEMVKTDRGVDQYFSYYQVRDQDRIYWIDTRAVTLYEFAQISNRRPENFDALVNQSQRQDGLYRNPALTGVDSLNALGQANSLDKKVVSVTELVDTRRPGNSQTYTYAHIHDGSSDYWLDDRALSRINFDQITRRETVNFTTAINGSSRNDGLYAAPALTNQNSLTAIAQAAGLNHCSVQVSEIDTTKRASNGQTYRYARITIGRETYWVDLRSLFSPLLSQENVDYSAWIAPQTGQDQSLYAALPKNSPDAFAGSQSIDSLLGKSIQVIEIDRLSDNATQAVDQFAKISVGGRIYWLRLENLQFARVVSQSSLGSGQSLIVQKKTHRNDGIFFNGPGLTAMNTMAADRQGLSYNAHEVTLLSRAVTVRPNGGQYVYAYVQDGSQRYWIDMRALASSFQYLNGVKYYDPVTHVLLKDATITDRGYSYQMNSQGNLLGSNSQIERAISAGLSLVGRSPYLWGGGRDNRSVADRRFDCSSFVYWCYQQAGIRLGNRSSVVTWSLAEEGRKVSWDSMKRGDLFLMDDITHVGIYLGGGYFLHDSPNSPTGGVGISNLSDIVNSDDFPYSWEEIQDNRIRRILE